MDILEIEVSEKKTQQAKPTFPALPKTVVSKGDFSIFPEAVLHANSNRIQNCINTLRKHDEKKKHWSDNQLFLAVVSGGTQLLMAHLTKKYPDGPTK